MSSTEKYKINNLEFLKEKFHRDLSFLHDLRQSLMKTMIILSLLRQRVLNFKEQEYFNEILKQYHRDHDLLEFLDLEFIKLQQEICKLSYPDFFNSL
jgi:hypothetical protein